MNSVLQRQLLISGLQRVLYSLWSTDFCVLVFGLWSVVSWFLFRGLITGFVDYSLGFGVCVQGAAADAKKLEAQFQRQTERAEKAESELENAKNELKELQKKHDALAKDLVVRPQDVELRVQGALVSTPFREYYAF